MKNILLLIFFGSYLLSAQYTTPNTGVNWNLNDLVNNSSGVVTGNFPNYSINNLVVVSANDRVYIQPGSIVNFTGTAGGFEVNGKFIAAGTVSDSIIFTSANQDSTGAYEGFRFNDTAVDSACIISYARIEYAYYGMRCVGASPTLSNSFLWKCRRPVQLSTSDAVIINNKLLRGFEYGILINLNSNPVIDGNEIAFNNTQATSAKNQISVGLQGVNSPVVTNNIIHSGSGIVTGGISLWVSGASSNMIIEGNTIYNNSFGITMLASSGSINAVVKNNIIYNNTTNPNALVSGSGINVNGNSLNAPVITGNEIFGNWWGVTIQNGTTVQPGPNPNLGNIENADPNDDGLNIIYDNIQGSNIYDLYNNCTNDIMAQNNDWRVYDSASIESHIFHKADDPAHGLVTFMPFSNFIPVELISFIASVNANSVTLKWSTASERNNQGFQVQRASSLTTPGQEVQSATISADDWKEIIFIEGSGTSTEIKNYSFIDENLSEGKYFYRLKQIDFDGSYEYSKIIEVFVASPLEYVLYQNYPNPFNPATKIKYVIPHVKTGYAPSLRVQLKVYDILGNEIATLVNEVKEPGVYEAEISSSLTGSLVSGVYFYQLKAGDFIQTMKMILLQ